MKLSSLSVLLALVFLCAACAGGGRSASPADFSAYSHRMHNRFYNAWVPPESVSVKRRKKVSVPVDVEIDERGRVVSFTRAKSSGDPAIDESIEAVGRKIRKVARPPGTTASKPFQLRVNFELDVR